MMDWAPLASASAVAPRLAAAAVAIPSFTVPYQRLAEIPGWIVWLGHPPVPDLQPFDILPAPPQLLWDDPATAIVTAAGVAVDYAQHRGATAPSAVATVLRREGPVVVVVPEAVHPSISPLLTELETLGISVLHGSDGVQQRLSTVASLAARIGAHAVPIARLHDPALSFDQVRPVDQIGGNPLSSFVLHHEAERDAVRVTGAFGPRLAIEIGVLGHAIDLTAILALEQSAATYVGFLSGVMSRIEGHSLQICWAEGAQPSAEEIGEAFRAWLKALDRVDSVDVHIAFAPPAGRSALLTDMRARAAAYKELRASAFSGLPAPTG